LLKNESFCVACQGGGQKREKRGKRREKERDQFSIELVECGLLKWRGTHEKGKRRRKRKERKKKKAHSPQP